MKKNVLKVIAGATLVAAMIVGMQMKNIENESMLTIDELNMIAFATTIESYPDEGLNCRCHNDGNCYGGNWISFRKKCADDTTGTGDCRDHDSNCPS